MSQQTTPSSQRRQNDQNGCVKAWKLASHMSVIETKKTRECFLNGNRMLCGWDTNQARIVIQQLCMSN
jgi:hypothetical protein